MNIYIFSEIKHNGYFIDILLPSPKTQRFYDLVIQNNALRESLCIEIGIDFRGDFDIIVENTSYISKSNVYGKIYKYHSYDKITLFNITRWFYKIYPDPIIQTRINNVVVLRHDIIAKLFGLKGDYLDDYKKAIDLNYAYDLDGMKKFREYIEKKYFVFKDNEYRKFMDNL